MDNLREEFEQWWNNKMAMCFYSQPKSQKETIYHASWLAWRSSRASIVVEIPDTDNYWNGTSGNEIFNHRQFAADSCDALRDVGLSIKGE